MAHSVAPVFQSGGTALIQAAFGNKKEVADFLIKQKANLELTTNVSPKPDPQPSSSAGRPQSSTT